MIEYGTKGDKFYILLSGYCDVVKPTLLKHSEDDIKPIIDSDMKVIRKKPLVHHANNALVANVERVGHTYSVRLEKKGELFVSDSETESTDNELNDTGSDAGHSSARSKQSNGSKQSKKSK